MKTTITRRQFTVTAAGSPGLAALAARSSAPATVFADRGYYILPCRAPTLGYEACREMVDAMAEDSANTVILWLGGSFRSRKFPITWRYNADHRNVREDFMGRLIQHAHTRGMKCLLGFTPFGYDGVNQYPREHPELKARQPDGKPVAEFGIHSWGWNFWPARPESQQFILHAALGSELFGPDWRPTQVEDTLELCRVLGTQRNWSLPAPLTTPGLVESRRQRGRLDAKNRALLREQLSRVRAIAARHRDARAPGSRDLAGIAQWLGDQWKGANAGLLED
jgi:hypothetical protein